MTRLANTARRRFGQVSSTIASASRHFVPAKMNSWKLALYVIVFLLPGGSFAVLAMGWFDNRLRRKAAAGTSKPTSRALLNAPCSACPGGGATSR